MHTGYNGLSGIFSLYLSLFHIATDPFTYCMIAIYSSFVHTVMVADHFYNVLVQMNRVMV